MGNLERIRIAVVEPDARWKNHLIVLLGEPPLNAGVTTHLSADSALSAIATERPDVLVLDARSATQGDAQTTARFKAAERRLHIVVHGLGEDSRHIFSLLASGADALVSRSESSPKLVEAIESVRRGQSFLSACLVRVLVESLRKTEAVRRDLDGLSRRELDVLQLLSTGSTDQQIARSLGIAVRTVGTHLQHIYEKIDVHTRAAAVAKYLVGSTSSLPLQHLLNSRAPAAPSPRPPFRKPAVHP